MGLLKQIARFIVVGGLAFLVDYGVLWALVDLLGANYLVASALSFAVSVVFNYALSVLWVFPICDSGPQGAYGFIWFCLLSLIGLLLNTGIMWIGVDHLRLNYLFAKIFSTGIVMVYNFISRKLILEKKKPGHTAGYE